MQGGCTGFHSWLPPSPCPLPTHCHDYYPCHHHCNSCIPPCTRITVLCHCLTLPGILPCLTCEYLATATAPLPDSHHNPSYLSCHLQAAFLTTICLPVAFLPPLLHVPAVPVPSDRSGLPPPIPAAFALLRPASNSPDANPNPVPPTTPFYRLPALPANLPDQPLSHLPSTYRAAVFTIYGSISLTHILHRRRRANGALAPAGYHIPTHTRYATWHSHTPLLAVRLTFCYWHCPFLPRVPTPGLLAIPYASHTAC